MKQFVRRSVRAIPVMLLVFVGMVSLAEARGGSASRHWTCYATGQHMTGSGPIGGISQTVMGSGATSASAMDRAMQACRSYGLYRCSIDQCVAPRR